MKKSNLYTIGLATLLALAGLTSAYVIGPELVDAPNLEPKQELDFDEDTFMYRDVLDATLTADSYMLWDDWGGSWSDAEKAPGDDGAGNPPPDNPGEEDDLMCWAAAASNVLEWTEWGLVSGMGNADQVFQHFQDHWFDDGSLPEYAWHWWFNGTEIVPGPGWSYVDVPGGGNFWPTYLSTDYYDEQWTESQTLEGMDAFLHGGYGVALAIYTDAGGGHAITCWGFSYDSAEPDYYVGIWVTDSDDDKHLTSPPDSLRYYEVAYNSSESRWHLQNLYGSNNWYIGGVMALRSRALAIIVPDHYPTIQQAINAATSGDTIYVRAGTYYEHVVVNKTVSLIGENQENTILKVQRDAEGGGGMHIVGNNATISGFTITYDISPTCLVYIQSHHNTIRGNILTQTGTDALVINGGTNNTLIDNLIVVDEGGAGIGLIMYANFNVISNNTVLGGWAGVVLIYSANNVITNNVVEDQTDTELPFDGTVSVQHSSGNMFYHNSFINDVNRIYVLDSVGVWDNGYPSGGNYWSDYAGADLYWGPYQNETGSDGIGDTQSSIDEDNRDRYPLMSPFEYWASPIPGDINKDGKVDSDDLSQIAVAYGSATQGSNWNPNCDLNGDEQVDVLDLFSLGKNHGRAFHEVKVGLVLATGGLGDKSLNDVSYAGIIRASQELEIDFEFVEPMSIVEYEGYQRAFAATGDYEIIICVGSDQAAALTNVAADYPNQKFAIVDMVVDKPNVASLLFKPNEGSFLVGVVAGMKTNTGKVGFVGGMDIPLVRDYFVGYEAGASWVNSSVEIVAPVFVGGWADPARGKELAIELIDQGVDVIYASAGKSGLGALQAAHERGVLGLGVDVCQCHLYPEIEASMTKRVDVAVFDIIEAVVDESFLGGVHRLGLKEEGVGCCRLLEEQGFWEDAFGFIHAPLETSVVDEIEDARDKIIAGEITVPSAFS